VTAVVRMNQLAGLVEGVIAVLEGEPLPPNRPPRPSAPIDRVPWALGYGLRRALTADDWATFSPAMPPADERGELLAAVVGALAWRSTTSSSPPTVERRDAP
jgi:hypothetical protein